MPTIAVDKAALFEALGEEWVNLSFAAIIVLKLADHVLRTATRQKRLMSCALNSTARIRPYVSGAILRNIKFTQERYDSFIALQDKLHQNLARQRTLVAIGTHDLDTIKAPFTYEALPPEDIQFVPLNQTKSMNGAELMEFYKNDKHLSRYLPIIRSSPVYPVILDANRTVCSMPPIINSDHSKITLTTRNVFIDITATDRTKAEIVNRILVCMFSQYTSEPFTIEPIQISSPHNNESRRVPDLTPRHVTASLSYINACCGLELSPKDACDLLTRMAYKASPSPLDLGTLDILVPPTRADILHQADIMEDVAIAYGFNNLPRSFPDISITIAQPLAINKLSDIIRVEAAMAGWSEVMPLILCSHAENFAHLNRKDDGQTAVKLANPKTAEYQVVRNTLLPGLLKTLRENKHHTLPVKVFEVSDVAFKDMSLERKSRNERHFAAAFMGKSSGFEIVHGLMDHIMLMLKSAFITNEEGLKGKDVGEAAYWIHEVDDPTFFPGHAASIHLSIGGREQVIGVLGILHPTVLQNFDLRYPVSTLEMNVEVFL
ncbi:MAG: hypothetical protein Q9163_001502 [Psora crenata]